MNTFKSWLVANLEVILIIFSFILFIAGVVKCIHAPDDDTQGVWILACAVIAVICGIVVFCVRGGFRTLIGFVLFVGVVVGTASVENKELQSDPAQSIEIQADSDNDAPASENKSSSPLKLWPILVTVGAFSAAGGIAAAIYANRNFYDVVSRRFLYRNSLVSTFEEQWKYTFNRFYAGFMTFFAIALEIIVWYIIHQII